MAIVHMKVKNTLNYVDNVDHRQWNLTLGADTQLNKDHLLSYGVGFVRETGEGSRLKNAPTTYKRHIDHGITIKA